MTGAGFARAVSTLIFPVLLTLPLAAGNEMGIAAPTDPPAGVTRRAAATRLAAAAWVGAACAPAKIRFAPVVEGVWREPAHPHGVQRMLTAFLTVSAAGCRTT